MKKTFLILFLCLCCLPSVCLAEPPQILERALESDPGQRYLVQLPAGYEGDKKCPVFIAIPWYTGTAEQQLSEWKFYANNEGYVLLCPQFADGYQWLEHGEDKKLIEIIEAVKKEFSVNPEKVFLVGFSGGAQFVHRFAFAHPEYICAAGVLAAGGYDSVPASLEAKRVKYFVAAGQEDERCSDTEHFASRLKNNNYDVVFKSFPGVGHSLHSSIKREVIDFLKNLDS